MRDPRAPLRSAARRSAAQPADTLYLRLQSHNNVLFSESQISDRQRMRIDAST
jgi:hypothetical protein